MFAAQAFISYSHSQFYFAESLVSALGQHGIPTWFDNRNIAPGSHWNETLYTNLGHSSHFVLVASRESISSGYVMQEWRTAIANGKRIIVVYFEAVDLPRELQTYPQISFQGDFDQAVARLVDVLRYDRLIKDQPIKTWLPNGNKSVFAALLIVGAITALLTGVLTIILLVALFQIDNFLQETYNSILQYLPSRSIRVGGNLYVEHFFHSSAVLLYGVLGASLFFLVVLVIRRQRIRFGSLIRALQLIPGVLGFLTLITILIIKQPPAVIGWTVFILVVAFAIFGIWTARRTRRSPDVLRWMLTGSAPDEMRRQFHFPHIFMPIPPEQLPLRRWQLLSANDADAKIVDTIRHEFLRMPNLRESNSQEIDWRVVILGSQTPQSWIERFHLYQPNTVYVITSNVNVGNLGQAFHSSQWFDFRNIDNSESLAAFLSLGYAANTMTPIPANLATFRLPYGVENIYIYLISSAVGLVVGVIGTLVLYALGYTRDTASLGFIGIVYTYINPLLVLVTALSFGWAGYKLLHRDITSRRFLALYLGPVFLLVAEVVVLVLYASVSAGSTKNNLSAGLLLFVVLITAFAQLILPATVLFALVWFRKDLQHWLPEKISPRPANQPTIDLPGWYVPRYEAFIAGVSLLLGISYLLATVFMPTITFLK